MFPEEMLFEYGYSCEIVSAAGWININTTLMSLPEVIKEKRCVKFVEKFLVGEKTLSLSI